MRIRRQHGRRARTTALRSDPEPSPKCRLGTRHNAHAERPPAAGGLEHRSALPAFDASTSTRDLELSLLRASIRRPRKACSRGFVVSSSGACRTRLTGAMVRHNLRFVITYQAHGPVD